MYATPAGLELIHRLLAQFRREMAPATERLTPEQRDQLARLLELVLEKPPAAPVRPVRSR